MPKKTNKINAADRRIIAQLQRLLNIKLPQHEYLKPWTPGYAVNKSGAVTALLLYDSNLDDKALNTASQPLTALTALTSLDLGGNGLTDCSPLKPLTALKSLSLWNNKITDISPLNPLTALTSLYLAVNQITDISPLNPLTALTSLDLAVNQITDCSPLKPLTALTSLDLSQNNLTDISPLKPLTALTRLALHRNKIKDLPEWITELGMEIYSDNSYHETGIALENNPLETPPLEIVKQGKDAIRNYFAETASGELDHLYEAKLLIVGEERAGKSSLTEALSDPNYKFQAKPSTEGIDIKQWIIPSEGEVLPRG
ncbi:MAG: leucine-rich repeat domain-containing protein, partial [Phycisphaerae bacterium]|nr:leucine-rich repeat domain-containing protein [Phycisphaerae bacterium]